MKRNIITIDEKTCTGCGLCVSACHEGALQLVDGKARLISDSYCDGLGACLPKCPVDAIKIEEREAAPFDEAAVAAKMKQPPQAAPPPAAPQPHPPALPKLACGCPGTMAKKLNRPAACETAAPAAATGSAPSELRQWPVQIQLVPINAPYFDQAKLLVAADCTAYAYAGFHEKFMKGRITLIGCPKLDEADYSEKLGAIFANNDIKSVTVLRMEVPCCGGLVHAVQEALAASGKTIPWRVVTITTEGELVED
jgi:NAD-dependent dihydropyrimidine dehydrogenase PreA subunit